MTTETSPRETLGQGVARRVRGLMGEQRISGSRMALNLGMSQAAYSRRAIGELEFSLEEISNLAAILGVSEAYLLGFSDIRYAIRDSNPEPADLSSESLFVSVGDGLDQAESEEPRGPRRYGHLTAHDGGGEPNLEDLRAFACPFRVIPGRAS